MSDKAKREVYIEAWRNRYDGEHWVAEIRDSENPQDYEHPLSWFNSPHWNYKYHFNGRKARVAFCSQDCFTRDEAMAISLLIVEGRGVKTWRIDLN